MQDSKTVGKKKALIIAVSDYTDKTINQLPFCKNDGKKMYTTLRKVGFEIEENNKLIGRVSWQTMRDTLINFFVTQCKNSNEILLFYFSGHGLVDRDGTYYFGTSEIDSVEPLARGIDDFYFRKVIDKSPSKRIVLINDSCHAGKINPYSKGDSKSAASTASETISKMDMAEGRFFLASCNGYQESFGTQEGSKFTQYIIDGLNGNKDSVDKNGFVTPDSLASFVEEKMANDSEDGMNQKPIKKVEGSGDIILAIYEEFRQKINGDLDKDYLQKLSQLNILYSKGNALDELGKYEEAISYYDKVLEIDPKYVNGLIAKGTVLDHSGKYEEAIRWYDKALEIDPMAVFALIDKGNALNSLGKYEEAISYCNKVLEIDPKNVFALYNKGYALYSLSKYEEAISYYDKALEFDPENTDILNNRAMVTSKIKNQ